MNLTLTEKYALCLVNQKKQNNIMFFNSTYPLIIVASSFLELIMLNAINIDNKKIVITKDLNSEKRYLEFVYNSIKNSKPKTLKKWIETYIGYISTKKLKELFTIVIEGLALTDSLNIEVQPRLLKERTIYKVNKNHIESIINTIHEELSENNVLTNETIILTSLMLQVDILNKYFSKSEKEKLKKRINEINKSDNWDVVSIVKNALNEMYSCIIVTSII